MSHAGTTCLRIVGRRRRIRTASRRDPSAGAHRLRRWRAVAPLTVCSHCRVSPPIETAITPSLAAV